MKTELPEPEELIVLKYTFIDDAYAISKAEKVLDCTAENLALIEGIKVAFRRNGWEGDGELGLFWIPPFFYTTENEDETTYGTWVWHVKQHNNGVSFFGFTKEGLSYVRCAGPLLVQNDNILSPV
jgi:hypothetical protein